MNVFRYAILGYGCLCLTVFKAGGVFVDRAAEILLTDKLSSSRFGTNEYIVTMVQAFEKKASPQILRHSLLLKVATDKADF